MSGRILKWRPVVPHWGGADPFVWVSVAKLSKSWRRSSQYVSQGGGGDAIGTRYEKFGKWVAQGFPIDMCTIGLVEGVAEFTDGRHRFAWLRDHGVLAMPVHTSPQLVAEFARRFGALSQISVLPDAASAG